VTREHPHLNPYYVAINLDVGDDPQSANIIRRCAAERDLAVTALRRIHESENDMGFGDADMIAADALRLIEPDPYDTDDPEADYHEASIYLSELNAKGAQS
jgi:hypothetical protein